MLRWIVTSSLCTQATAQLVFWRAQPSFYTQFSSAEEATYEAEVYTLLRTIMQRWEEGLYQPNLIAYDPSTDALAEALDSTYPQPKWTIPVSLKQPIIGEVKVILD